MPTKKATPRKMFTKKQALATLNINRRTVRVDLSENFVCGGVEDYFEYEASLSTRGLTTEGFVTEVKTFIEMVEREYHPREGLRKASCEDLANGVVNIAHKIMGKRLVNASVEVYNLTGSVVVEFKSGDRVPAFPKIAEQSERKVRKQRESRSVC